MASAAGIILAAGGITLASELLAVPLDAGVVSSTALPINWRVIPATGAAALLFYGIDKLNHTLGVGLAAMTLITTLITPMGVRGLPPIQNILEFMGYHPSVF